MKITIKTLQGKQFAIDAEPTNTILQLKLKVGELQNFESPEECRLIFSGKVLPDEATVDASSITEKGFLVVMPPKKKAAVKASTPDPVVATTPATSTNAVARTVSKPDATLSTSGTTATTTTATPVVETKKSQDPMQTDNESSSAAAAAQVPVATTTPSTTAPPSAAPQSISAPMSIASNDFVMGQDFQNTVDRICEMGFEKEQVQRALRAAYNNPDRAIEFLFNGIPDIPEVQAPVAFLPSQSTPSSTTNPGTTQSTSMASDLTNEPFNMFAPPPQTRTGGNSQGQTPGAGAPAGSLDFLRRNPQFNVMRRVVQANPQLLQPLLQQIGQANPALLSVINANQQEFVRLINEPVDPNDDMVSDEALEAMGGDSAFGDFGGEFDGADGNMPPGSAVIEVTDEERAQIERLEQLVGPMGLDRAAVLEAWLACDKNEEMAANYLLNNMEEFLGGSGTGSEPTGGRGGN